ncbi:MAG TPA: hypothetical protein VN697_07505 [Tepidiformaceae bacterium]|jgi:hypothetical protein|nr:hypothetical protein [Tepidiformaceae bacterium]
MLVVGDVKCLHCGYLSGQWVGVSGAPLTVKGFRATPSSDAPAPEADTTALIRCVRCAGPVFLDEATAVSNSSRLRRIRRLREQIAALEEHKNRAA